MTTAWSGPSLCNGIYIQIIRFSTSRPVSATFPLPCLVPFNRLEGLLWVLVQLLQQLAVTRVTTILLTLRRRGTTTGGQLLRFLSGR